MFKNTLIIPTHSFIVLEKKLFDPQRGASNRSVNTFFNLLAQMIFDLFNLIYV
jgi:hypothetical protein